MLPALNTIRYPAIIQYQDIPLQMYTIVPYKPV